MRTAIKSDKIILPNGLYDGYLLFSGGKIQALGSDRPDCDTFYDFTGKYVSPGFIDLHTHGGNGISFAESTPEEVLRGCDFHLAHGTTSLLPTVSAGPFREMKAAVAAIAKAMECGGSGGNILGAHLEGPYLSPLQCGAQRPGVITPPVREEYESLVDEYGKYIARWSYAPENDRDGAFCRYICSHHILASAGHTNATYEEMLPAIEAGCHLITHLFSCTSTVTRDHGFRRLGVIETAFLRDELYVEIIADGKHLPPELIQLIIKIKGMDKVALVTDSLPAAGLQQKSGIMSGTAYIVEDGVAKLTDRSAFAGSIATADVLIRVLVKECGFSVADAVSMLTAVPARILGVKKGCLQPGYDADILAFDGDIQVSDVFVGGKKRALARP